MIGGYPLSEGITRRLALKLEKSLNADLYDWFLEPVGG